MSVKRKYIDLAYFQITDDITQVSNSNNADMSAANSELAKNYSGLGLNNKVTQWCQPGVWVGLDPEYHFPEYAYVCCPDEYVGWLSTTLLRPETGPKYNAVLCGESKIVPFRDSASGQVRSAKTSIRNDAASGKDDNHKACVALQKIIVGCKSDKSFYGWLQHFTRFLSLSPGLAGIAMQDLLARSKNTFEAHQEDVMEMIELLDFSAARPGKIEPHSSMEDHPEASIFSRRLAAKEWIRIEFKITATGQTFGEYTDVHTGANMSNQRFYHGTPLGAVLGMYYKGGFIPGQGTCQKKGKTKAGAFCTTEFFGAFDKGTSHLHDFAVQDGAGNKALNLLCMPTVIELEKKHLHNPPTSMHKFKHVFEGDIGKVLPGVLIRAVHINLVLFENYSKALELAKKGCLENPQQARLCGQNKTRFTGAFYQATCARFMPWAQVAHTSNTGIWYCQQCARFRTPPFDPMLKFGADEAEALSAGNELGNK